MARDVIPSLFADSDDMAGKTKFMVVASGAGEHNYKHDFSVVWVEAQTAEEAAQVATAPENGYGNDDGDVLYVCRTECVTRFVTAVRTVAEPVRDE